MAAISKAELRKEITVILKDADLASTTAKKIRQELEKKLDCNLSARRKEIDSLVMDYVSKQDRGLSSSPETDTTNKKAAIKKVDQDSPEDDASDEDEASDEEDASDEDTKQKKTKRAAPPKKKVVKKAKKYDDDDDDNEDDESGSDANTEDAVSEEEYSPKKTAKPKAKKPAKGRKKKGSDSDSDDDWNKSKKVTKKGKGRRLTAFSRPYKLSPELSKLLGSEEPMPRHEVIKRVWAIIKERNLYDPDNKQFAICDDDLIKVMGVKRFRTFGMMKFLKSHFLD